MPNGLDKPDILDAIDERNFTVLKSHFKQAQPNELADITVYSRGTWLLTPSSI